MTDKPILVDARVGWGSGIGRYVSNLVPLVAARMPGARFDVLVGSRDLPAAQAALAGANLRLIESDVAAFSLAEQWRLPRLASGYALTWFTNYWVPLRWPGRFVATVHDLMHLEPSIFPASFPKRRLSQATFAKVAHDAAGVLFVSRFSRRVFEQRFGAPPRAAVTHLGIDHRGFSRQPSAMVSDKQTRLLVVAAAKAHKNFAIVLDAWAQARVASHWTLTIVTPDDAGVRSMIDLKLVDGPNQVERLRNVSDADLQELYAGSAVLLMPSLYEGFGLPMVEGMAAGMSCIAAPAEALVEIASGGAVDFVNGRDLAGWIAAIERMCASSDTGDAAIAADRTRNMTHAAQFRWGATAERTTALLQDVLANAQ